MPAIWGAAASFAGSALGFMGQQETNSANAALARENRDWQQWMSSTAHRREVKDLIAAGLNPMLSSLRTGASTPPGAQATMQNPFSNSAENARAAMLIGAQVKKLEAEANQANSQAAKTTTETQILPDLWGAQIGHYGASADQHRASADNIRQEMTNFNNRVQNLLTDTVLKDSHSELLHSMVGKTDAEKMQILATTKSKLPAEVEQLKAHAQYFLQQAQLLKLKVPEGIAEAAFWGGPDARSAQYFRHAPKNFTSAWTGALGAGADEIRERFRYKPHPGQFSEGRIRR